MYKKMCKFSWCCLILSLCASSKILAAQNSIDQRAVTENPDSLQYFNLKKFHAFIFFPLVSAGSEEKAKKIQAIVLRELKKIGQVVPKELMHGNSIDLSLFSDAPSLVFKIENIQDLNGKNLSIMKASLAVSSSIKIFKTDQVVSGKAIVI
jgi:hypothetical protein